jgi:nucleoid-associated protein YgaU
MSFKHDGPPPVAAAGAPSEAMVRRIVEPMETARPLTASGGADVAARLTGRVEPHALAGNTAAVRPRVAGDYELTSGFAPAPTAEAADERTPRHHRVMRAAPEFSESAAPPSLPADGPFRTQNAALSSVRGDETVGVERTHLVRDGDSLGSLAARYYGDAGRYREILEANRDVLTSADVLPIGATLRIPAAGAVGSTAPAAPPAARIVPRLDFSTSAGR